MTSAAEDLARLRRALTSAAESLAQVGQAAEKTATAASGYTEALEGSSNSGAAAALESMEGAREKLDQASGHLAETKKNIEEYAAEAHGADLASPAAAVTPQQTPTTKPPADDLTHPSRQPDPNAVPEGELEAIPPRAKGKHRESIRLQNEAAGVMARAGYRVRFLPRSDTDQSPDHEIEGRIFDCLAPEGATTPSGIRTTMRRKASSGQADRFEISLDRSPLTAAELRHYLTRHPSGRIREAFVVKNESVTRVWP